MKAITLIFVLLSSFIASIASPTWSACVTTSANEVELTWKAFKTAHRLSVEGTFKQLRFDQTPKGESIAQALLSTTFTIDPSGVSTGMSNRDQSLAKHFFADLTIKGKVIKVSDKILELQLELNKVKRVIPLRYEIKDQRLSARGFLDVLDFDLTSQLQALTRACLALHEGKTWSDVELQVKVNFRECSP